MLSQKFKDFIEETASTIRDQLKRTEEPNKYNYDEILDWLRDNGAEIQFGEENRTDGTIITLNFYSEDENHPDGHVDINGSYEKKKIFFHEMWHFIFNKLSPELWPDLNDPTALSGAFTLDSVSSYEMAANFFAMSMIYPEKYFVKSIMDNISSNGSCDIYSVAEEFETRYPSVIARGKDLKLWSE